MMASAISQEKERDTLGLLFLTDLTPWELTLQKYIGRLIPMLTSCSCRCRCWPSRTH